MSVDEQLVIFLNDLRETGRLRVAPLPAELPHAMPLARQQLIELEEISRLDFPGHPPEFDPEIGLEGLLQLYQLARLFLDSSFAPLNREMRANPLQLRDLYSMDVVLRFLPQLIRLANAAEMPADVQQPLLEVARSWPLSSVGIGSLDIDSQVVDVILGCRALRLEYLDRILATEQTERLNYEPVLDALRAEVSCPQMLPGKIQTLLEKDHQLMRISTEGTLNDGE